MGEGLYILVGFPRPYDDDLTDFFSIFLMPFIIYVIRKTKTEIDFHDCNTVEKFCCWLFSY